MTAERLILSRFVVAALCCVALAGCVTTKRPSLPSQTEVKGGEKKGVYHKVNKGETLWRIAKTYKIPVEDIARSNGIPNAASIEENQLLFIPGAEAVLSVDLPRDTAGSPSDYLWPLKGKIVSYFEDRKGAYNNRGLDIQGVEGDIVRASREGRVVLADNLPGYGFTVILDHADGFFTVYGRNERLLVKLGDYVFRGEKVAQIGQDGSSAVFHFEVRRGDVAQNPLHYLPREM